MNSVCEPIEHSYCVIANRFQACSNYDNIGKLKQKNPHLKEELFCCYLFANISTILQGSQVNSNRTFACMSPSLIEYLHV